MTLLNRKSVFIVLGLLITAQSAMSYPAACRTPRKRFTQALYANLSSRAETETRLTELADEFRTNSTCKQALLNESKKRSASRSFDATQVVLTERYSDTGLNTSDPKVWTAATGTCQVEIHVAYSPTGNRGSKTVCRLPYLCPRDVSARLKSNEVEHVNLVTGGETIACNEEKN